MKRVLALSCASLAYLAATSAAHAQTDDGGTAAIPANVMDDAPDKAQEIVVTGTRRTDRTALQSNVPVDVLTAADFQRQGSTDTNSMLRTLIPSFNVARFAANDTAAFVRPPTLRGLPPDDILVLINGKRFHRSSLVQLDAGDLSLGAQGPDIAQIPAIALERVEVLRDGAAAQYGSDAIAGVINFNLKHRDKGLELTGRYGQFYKGDGQNYQIAGNLGLALGPNGFLNISGEYVDAGRTQRGGQRPSAAALVASDPSLAGKIPNPAMRIGDPRLRTTHIFVNGGLDVGPGQLYLFGNFGHTETAIDFNYRQAQTVVGPDRFGTGTQTFGRAAAFYTIFLDPVAPGSTVYDINGRTFNYATKFPYGFTPLFSSTNTDLSLTGGYKGEIGNGLHYDLSASWGRNRLKLYIDNTVNPSLGPDSPTSFYLGDLAQTEKNLNLDLSYAANVGLASPLTIAIGGERRDEGYEIGAGDPASYAVGPYSFQRLNGENPDPEVTGNVASQSAGSNGYPGHSAASAINKNRVSYAAYADIAADVVKGLSLDAAIRYEHFSDFGSTTNYKLSGRYAIDPAIAIRGAVSTGFRAPTPGQLFTQNIATNYQGANLVETATLPATDPAAEYFGARPLKPEKSNNYSAGLVFTPAPALSATVDVYQIDVRDRIGLSGQFVVATQAQRDDLRTLGVANWATLGQVQYFTNAFSTRTRGVDFVLSHSLKTASAGRFDTILSANYNNTTVTSRATLPVQGVPTLIVNDIRKGNIEHLNPKFRATFTETWSDNRWSLMGRVNFAGQFTAYDTVANGGNLTLDPQATIDLEASYDLNKSVRLSVGAENLLDSHPDKTFRALGQSNQNLYAATQTTLFATRYVDASPFGYNGGFWYVRMGLKF